MFPNFHAMQITRDYDSKSFNTKLSISASILACPLPFQCAQRICNEQVESYPAWTCSYTCIPAAYLSCSSLRNMGTFVLSSKDGNPSCQCFFKLVI